MTMTQTGERHASKLFGIDSNEEAAVKQYDQMNPGLRAAREDALNRARAIAGRAYTPYEGRRVAGLSANETAGVDMARRGALQRTGQSYVERGAREVDEVAENDFTAENIQRYANPYIEGVVNRALRDESRAYGEQKGALVAGRASRGAFGSDRQTMLESNLARSHLEAQGDISSRGYADAFNSAVQTWQADNDRRIRASDAYRAAGSDINRMDSDQIADLMRTGGVDRVLEQMELDTDYSEFIERRDWDITNLQPLLQAAGLGSVNAPNVQQQGGSDAGQIMGAVSSIVGYFGSRGNGGGSDSYGGTGAGGGAAPNNYITGGGGAMVA